RNRIPRVEYTERFGMYTIARASAFTVAAIPSIRDEFFDRSGLVNIRLSLLSFDVTQLAFQRRTGCPPWWSLPAVTNSSNFLDGSDSVPKPCRISMHL